MQALYDQIIKECGDFSHIRYVRTFIGASVLFRLRITCCHVTCLFYSESCSDLLNEMSKEIGKVNIYDIYDKCNSNLPPSGSRAR